MIEGVKPFRVSSSGSLRICKSADRGFLQEPCSLVGFDELGCCEGTEIKLLG